MKLEKTDIGKKIRYWTYNDVGKRIRKSAIIDYIDVESEYCRSINQKLGYSFMITFDNIIKFL